MVTLLYVCNLVVCDDIAYYEPHMAQPPRMREFWGAVPKLSYGVLEGWGAAPKLHFAINRMTLIRYSTPSRDIVLHSILIHVSIVVHVSIYYILV